MYELTGVCKVYTARSRTVPAVSGVDLTVADGEWIAIRGRTGHGKSTLLNLLGGLDRPTSGQLRLDGRDLGRMRDAELTRLRATAIGFVFQTFNLVPTLSAAENVAAALVPLRAGPAQWHRRVPEALDSVGLADRARHLPGQLSGGQQQRVAIARALVKEPKVLLADEPTGNLDTDTRDEILALLEKIWRERALTLVLVSHDGAVVRRAQRVGTMSQGRITFREPGGQECADLGPNSAPQLDKTTSQRSVSGPRTSFFSRLPSTGQVVVGLLSGGGATGAAGAAGKDAADGDPVRPGAARWLSTAAIARPPSAAIARLPSAAIARLPSAAIARLPSAGAAGARNFTI